MQKLSVHPDVHANLLGGGIAERGWLLLGNNGGDGVAVRIAFDVGGAASESSVEIDKDYAFIKVRNIIRRYAELAIVGFAHSHLIGYHEPSVFDFRGDSQWVNELPGKAGVFAIVAKDVVKWFYLAAGDRWYRRCQD